jgi:hypothetical protein
MSKKLITACMALVALAAFALPAVASATNDPDLTHPTGTLLATSTAIRATSTSIIKLKDSSGNTLTECSTGDFNGTLTKNDGSNVEGSIESSTFSGTGASGECTSTFGGITVDTNIGNGTPWCVRSTSTMVTDEVQIRGNSCANAARSITFVLTSTTVGTCKYNRVEPIKGTYTTHSTGDAIITVTAAGATGSSDAEFLKEEGGIFCPGAGRLEGSWTLETNAAGTSPLYIS